MRLHSFGVAACFVTLIGWRASAQYDMSTHAAGGPVPAFPGQAAFATIGQVVAILEADSTTDWSAVNLDALREHLIDMDEVLMRASVEKNVPGGFEARVTGTGRTTQAIRRMLTSQSAMLDQDPRLGVRGHPHRRRPSFPAPRGHRSRSSQAARPVDVTGL